MGHFEFGFQVVVVDCWFVRLELVAQKYVCFLLHNRCLFLAFAQQGVKGFTLVRSARIRTENNEKPDTPETYARFKNHL